MSLVLQWLKDQGGVELIEAQNEAKAKLIYDAIDGSDFYYGTADAAHRSVMNVAFNLHKEDLLGEFVKQAEAADLYALKGHRAVGGARASIYNAMPRAGCEALVEFMSDFESVWVRRLSGTGRPVMSSRSPPGQICRMSEEENHTLRCDCFYASIEMRDNPELADKPIAVGGSPERRGVVATCNYAARKFGIHSAMSSAIAR